MKLKPLLTSLGCAILLLALYAWPVVRHFSTGIPYTSVTADDPPARFMVMGDHLQLLYHFWLMADWMTGDTAWGHNPYLFNTGDDAATACPASDYWPFSIVFGLFHLVFSRATSWNLTILLVLWLTHYFLSLLLRRHGASSGQATLVALIAIGIPYQWTTLFGGSPTGFAMVAVPMVLYGMDRALRDGSIGGGLVATAGLLAAFWTDAHVLLFLMLTAPLWGLLVLLYDERFPWRGAAAWGQRALAAAPLLVTAVAAAYLRMKTKAGLGDTIIGGGRDWREVAIFSPRKFGLFQWQTTGHDHTIYLGVLLCALMGAGLVWGLVEARRRRAWRPALFLLALAAGLGAIVLFALGTNGPRDAWVLRTARELLPPIGMIRQPAKIFAIVFPIVALLILPAFRWLTAPATAPAWRRWLPTALVAVIVIDLSLQIRPGVSLLDQQQGAYAAVAADAERPHALVTPIWPGDSAWASLYQHYASLHRVRLINGYLPVVQRAYVDTVYRTLESVNTGHLDDRQIRFLADRGIRYLIFHQNAYPEQVSWFPVGAALRRYLLHPRLQLLEQDGPVWAFRILEQPDPEAAWRPWHQRMENWRLFGSRIQSEMEHERLTGGAIRIDDPTASAEGAIRLTAAGDGASMGDFNHQDAIDPHLLIRLRGEGQWTFRVDNEDAFTEQTILTAAPEWEWLALPATWRAGTQTIRPSMRLAAGTLELDRVAYVAGLPPQPEPGTSFFIPAPTLFHAGHTDMERQAVVFDPWREPRGRILYGPRWPVPEGRYEAVIEWAEPAPDSAKPVGQFEIKLGTDDVAASVALNGRPDDPPLIFSTVGRNLPLEFGFHYERTVPLAIKGIRVTRTE